MSQSATAEVDWRRLAARTGLYPAEAFQFVRDGLNRTSELVHGPGGPGDADRHVSGQQLCLGLRDHAIEQFGLLAPAVLAHWHIHRTEDFGRMVFGLIDAGLMSKTPQDSLEDFRSVYDFAEAFGREHVAGAMRVPAG